MSIRNLDKMFAPRSVALIGASAQESSVGQVLLKNLMTAGFQGSIAAVNPHTPELGGIKAVANIAALAETPDLAVIATPPHTVPGIIDELGQRGTRAAVIITAGFGELGAEGKALQARILDAARPSLMRIAGPNCLGIMVPGVGLNASFAHLNPLKGDIAFVSQSGAVVTAMLDWATTRGIGFSHIASLGGMSDVDFGDMLDYLARDPQTRSILLYIESVSEARKFLSAGRQAARLKPVLIIKSGRHAAAAKAAASHTGALAGSDAVYQAAFRRAGMLRVDGIEDLFDAVETLSTRPERKLLAGNRLAILTNGGGVGVLATDFVIDEGGRIAELAPETLVALDEVLPRTWSHANPVDIIGDAPASRYAASIDVLLRDPNTDAVLAMNCPTAVVDNVAAAHAVADAAEKSVKPVFTSWIGDQGARAGRQVFMDRRIPTYDTPNQAIHAFMLQVRYQRNQRLLMEIPKAGPAWPDRDLAKARRIVDTVLAEKREWLNEFEAKALVGAYGIPIVETRTVHDADEAARVAGELGFPAALKILSPDISHKTDVGGVALGLESVDAVRGAARMMLENVGKVAHGARVEGFTVQRMVSRPNALELILGIVDDVTFGPVILFGQGGTAVEIIRDKAMALPPLNAVLADDLIRRTRISKLLEGYRGRPPADFEAITGALMALGDLAADLPEVCELDINPLWADDSGVIALDARVRVREAKQKGTGRFAVKPYPVDLEGSLKGRDGKAFPMRPIRPEDTQLIDEALENTAPEDLRMRFLSPLRRLPRQLAARLTQIDYDREMAFVVFTDESMTEVAGVGRLSEDPNRERAEYAILVRTDRQGLGLGYALMTHLIAYAKSRGVGEVFGHVLRENMPMLDLCDEFGFTRERIDGEPGVVEVVLDLKD
ncbi:MAG: bifunctional acetate--CoA ligase family protein/GNAT family N-acetyltransferase [Parvibaculum sp.]|uniref:bifunctional acetate--CoA ligase family protein/GNAT family N-acetyltransferase n=1 Tax=Parvibaculum sp. TaxID=2024848 RepID=UPI0025E79DD3|nr:bifunctional acetate--CoA ligase family protein/GNAT family N-acetyltransferase [Parvibaculum sp.]MCE9649154.1 bifunctional acetate--CoA ligase family protein/GNAT family N-acetyltransferase [Parvibaculum sp.]